MLLGPVRTRLEQLIGEGAAATGWDSTRLAIQPAQLHLFMRATPHPLPSAIPRRMKGRRSPLLREEVPHLLKRPSLWTRSFFLSTAGNVRQESIERSSARQAKT